MLNENKILGLEKLGQFIIDFFSKKDDNYNEKEERLAYLMTRSEIENPWFTQENQRYNLKQWASLFTKNNIENWLSKYPLSNSSKRVGLILAGNIPLVGFHDIISVVLSNHIPVIKLSSKDRLMLPYLLQLWNEFSNNEIEYQIVEKLENFDAVIATGSNNTARYLEYYFKDNLSIIRKNRTSVAVLKGDETDEEYHGADESEDMHRLLAEVGEEPQRQQVEVAVEEAVDAELRVSVFPGLVVDDLLTNLVEARVLGQVGDVAVHLAVDLDVLHHIATIILQSAVEVMEVVNAGNFAGRSVEELRRDRL